MTQQPLAFTPLNNVEQLQAEAATTIEKREEFWKALLESDIYVLSEESEKDNEVILFTWQGKTEDTCAAFTSLEKLCEAMPPDTPYIVINARIILQSMVDENMGVFINPRYEPSVKLRSKEISSMLKGNYNEVIGRNT